MGSTKESREKAKELAADGAFTCEQMHEMMHHGVVANQESVHQAIMECEIKKSIKAGNTGPLLVHTEGRKVHEFVDKLSSDMMKGCEAKTPGQGLCRVANFKLGDLLDEVRKAFEQ